MSELLLSQSATFLLVLTRFLGMMTVAPLFAGKWVPVRFRIGLAFLMAVLMTGFQMPTVWNFPDFGCAWLGEVLLGLTLGATILAFFTALHVAGSVVAYGSGLSFPVDEGISNEAAPILAEFFTLFGIAIVFLAGGHLVVVESVLRSFQTFPPGEVALRPDLFMMIPKIFATGFELGIHMALPIATVLLLSQIGMAILSRVMPQLNVFSLSFSVNGLLVLFTLALAFGGAMILFRERFFNFLGGFHVQ